jgi:tRNA(fMet)-specific endonuclease VapC
MGLVIDTCVFIRAEKCKTKIAFEKWAKHGDVYISAITASELLVGVHRSANKACRTKRSFFVENIINNIHALDFTLDTARIHADLHACLLSKGLVIGSHDLLIAATAIKNDCAVLTTNIKEFERIPKLRVLAFE